MQLDTSICLKNKISGLAVYYNYDETNIAQLDVIIENFQYSVKKPCLKNLQCAVGLLVVHIHGMFSFTIQNTVFTNLSNSSVFCYYGIADSKSTDEETTKKFVLFKNVTVSYNTGYGNLYMFQSGLFSVESQLESPNNFYSNAPIRLYNMLEFHNCEFIGNTNIDAMIYVHPATYSKVVGNITIILIVHSIIIKMYSLLKSQENIKLCQM